MRPTAHNNSDHKTNSPLQVLPKGWDTIGSMKDRKKENTIEARPWAGETLKAGKKVGSTTKMEVFKDPVRPSRLPFHHRIFIKSGLTLCFAP